MTNLHSSSEQWLPVIGYEGLYEVSNFGNVRSLDRQKYGGSQLGGYYLFKGRVLRQSIKSGHGYPTVALWKSEKQKTHKVHRLVAAAFIPNPNKLPQVNHIDGTKTNARADNLEWVKEDENSQHAWKTGLSKRPAVEKRGKDSRLAKAIFQCDLSGSVINKWGSLQDAKRAGYSAGNICMVLKGQRPHHKGFLWKYAE
jgi:hypothetical protein